MAVPAMNAESDVPSPVMKSATIKVSLFTDCDRNECSVNCDSSFHFSSVLSAASPRKPAKSVFSCFNRSSFWKKKTFTDQFEFPTNYCLLSITVSYSKSNTSLRYLPYLLFKIIIIMHLLILNHVIGINRYVFIWPVYANCYTFLSIWYHLATRFLLNLKLLFIL